MATHFLDDFVSEFERPGLDTRDLGAIGKPWYNPYGDCVEFVTENVAYIGERIDAFLTIYRHHETRKAIGFQVKGVHGLMERLPIDGIKVEAEVEDGTVTRISLYALLMIAFKEMPDDDLSHRFEGYREAFLAKHQDDDFVEVAESVC